MPMTHVFHLPTIYTTIQFFAIIKITQKSLQILYQYTLSKISNKWIIHAVVTIQHSSHNKEYIFTNPFFQICKVFFTSFFYHVGEHPYLLLYWLPPTAWTMPKCICEHFDKNVIRCDQTWLWMHAGCIYVWFASQ